MAVGLLLAPSAGTAQTEGDYLYNVTMLRAAPGHYTDLVEALQESNRLVVAGGDEAPLWVRHSQGDQWDFMLIYPLGDLPSHFSPPRASRRAESWGGEEGSELASRLASLTSYREEWFATSIEVAALRERAEGMGLYHIEMFAGLPGRRAELLEQRRMENRYYTHLNRQLNVLFVRVAGSNWDAMTIGFHESLQSFANSGAQFSEAEQEEAAKVAGFEGVNTIGPYLRSLLSYHNDTFAVPVQ